MQYGSFNLDDAVVLLERMPSSLNTLLTDLPERWLRATEGDGDWSPYEVIEHLIQSERTNWMVRVRHILTGEQGPFAPFDRIPSFTESYDKNVAALLAIFTELRRANVAALLAMNLTNADLSRTGQHPEFGEVQLGQLLATWVVHDLNHMGQIVRTMAKVYGDAVGPWSVYLSILQD